MGLGRVLPWWACLALALVSYLILHAMAIRPLPPPDPKQLSNLMTGAMFRGLAAGGQYLLPIGFVAAAFVSFFGRRQRRELVERATGPNAADAIAGMSWQQFEAVIGEGFRLQGFQVAERTQGGADGGIDLVLRRGTEKFLVQAKHWKAYKVGVEVVRELYGLMAAEGAAGGFVVTSGRFTDEATAFAEGRNVKLVDGTKLDGLLRQAKASGGPVLQSAPAARSQVLVEPKAEAPTGTSGVPTCPACSRTMVLRTARKGANAGSSFWGCSAYSSGCRGTRPT